MSRSKTSRKRRKRRQDKQRIKNGWNAAPSHRLKSGRTGKSMRSKQPKKPNHKAGNQK